MNPLSFDHSLRLARGHRSTRAITPSPTFFVRIFVVRLRRPIRTTSDNRESSQGPPPPGLGFKKGRESLLSSLLRQFRRRRGAPSCILWDEKRIFTCYGIFDISNHFPTLCSGYCVVYVRVRIRRIRKEGEKSFLRSLSIESFEVINCETRFRPSWNNKYRIDHFSCKLQVVCMDNYNGMRCNVAFKRQSQGQLWTSLQFI